MRKKIYLPLTRQLRTPGLGIKQISLWNNDLERLAGQKAFRTPAVFVEFEPIEWRQLSMGLRAADIRMRLHVISKTSATPEVGGKYQEQAIAHLDTADKINAVIQGFGGEGFGSFTLVGTIPDHDHEQLLHEELIYATHVIDDSAAKQFQRARPKPAITATIKKSQQP